MVVHFELDSADRYHYLPEKGAALAKLAALIEAIVHPRANVVPLPLRTR